MPKVWYETSCRIHLFQKRHRKCPLCERLLAEIRERPIPPPRGFSEPSPPSEAAKRQNRIVHDVYLRKRSR